MIMLDVIVAERLRLRERIAAVGLDARSAAIERLATPGLGMRTRPAGAQDLASGASRLGGDPDLPATARWPQGSGDPPLFILQVDLAAVARFDPEHLLPQQGLLSLFVDCWGREVHLEYTAPGTTLQRLAADQHSARRFQPCGLDLFNELHLPPPGSPPISDEEDSWSSDERSAYWNDLWLPWHDEQRPGAAGTCGIHQMFGYAVPESSSSTRLGDVVLFGVDSDDRAGVEWGDVHTLWVLMDRADLAVCAWSKAHALM